MPASDASRPDTMRFQHPIPVLAVRDLKASIDHYVTVLGFQLDWADDEDVASVSRGKCSLYLCQGDQGHPGGWVWIGVGSVMALLEEYRESGATIRTPPTSYPWALEMQVEDPDGNVLRFGSDPKPNRRAGVWLDMRGVLWRQLPDGTWTEIEDR